MKTVSSPFLQSILNNWGTCSSRAMFFQTGLVDMVEAYLKTNPDRFGPGSFRLGSFRPGSFRPIFGMWVVSALVGRSFRPFFGVGRFGPGSFRSKSIETNKV